MTLSPDSTVMSLLSGESWWTPLTHLLSTAFLVCSQQASLCLGVESSPYCPKNAFLNPIMWKQIVIPRVWNVSLESIKKINKKLERWVNS